MTRTGVLSDGAWEQIEPLLPSSAGLRGGRWRDHRQVIEAIAWRYRTGAPWRDLPEEFGPFQTIWKRHDRWSRDGTWERLVAAVQSDADAAGELDWLVSVDSTVVRAHQHAAGARRDADTLPELEAVEPAGAEVATVPAGTGGTVE
jgi:transposase